MYCTKCKDGMGVDPDGNEKPGFVYCHNYKGWMSNNGSCYPSTNHDNMMEGMNPLMIWILMYRLLRSLYDAH